MDAGQLRDDWNVDVPHGFDAANLHTDRLLPVAFACPNPHSEQDKATKLKISWPRYRLIAVPEAAAVVGLLAGLSITAFGVAAAAGLVALMAGALIFRIRARDTIPWLVGDAEVLVLAAVTAVLRAVTA